MFNLIFKVRNRKGFTLVELLVVLAVLAIISAIAIPRFAGVQKSAKEKADQETLNTIQRALELCVAAESEIKLPDTGKTADILTVSDEIEVLDTSPITKVKIEEYIDIAKTKLNNGSKTFVIDDKGNITTK